MKKLVLFFSCAAMLFSFTSCSDSKNNDDLPIVNPDEGNDNTMGMTAEESKLYLESTARSAMDMIENDTDINKFIPAAHCFTDEYAECELPSDILIISADDEPLRPSKMMNAVAKAGRGDVSALSRAFQEYSYNINFNEAFGTYEPNARRTEWIRVGNSTTPNAIQLNFTISQLNKKGQILIMPSVGSTSQIEYTDEWEDEYYDFNKGTWVYDIVRDIYHIALPKTVRMQVTLDNETVADVTLNTAVNEAAHNFSISMSGNVGNTKFTQTINGTDSELSSSHTVQIAGNTPLVTATARIQGKNLCNRTKIETSIENGFSRNRLTDYLTSGTSEANILNQLRVNATFKANDELLDLETYWFGDNNDQSSFFGPTIPAEATQTASLLNNCISASVADSNNSKMASLRFEPYMETYGNWWYCEIDGLLAFSDGTTYSAGEYFEGGFTNISNNFLDLVDSYERMWMRYSTK